MSIKRLIFAIILINLATTIRAETINCTAITSVPATITAQGIYCLTGNLSTSQSTGNAITINANNVTLDLNGWKLGGQGAGLGTQAYGIYSTANNITIKNGIVRGFYFGIRLDGSGAVVQDMLLDGNTVAGIITTGVGALVEHNQVVNTGGSTQFSNAIGLEIDGSGSTASDNMVSTLTATGSGSDFGIAMGGGNDIVRNNIVTNNSQPSGGGTSYGIYNYFVGIITSNNTISNFVSCVYISAGSNIYSFNTVTNCTNDFTGGTAGASNSGT